LDEVHVVHRSWLAAAMLAIVGAVITAVPPGLIGGGDFCLASTVRKVRSREAM
jgi:hypothetical protein